MTYEQVGGNPRSLAEEVDSSEYCGNLSVKDYYDEIAKLHSASYQAQPREGGSLHTVIASGQRAEMIDKFIVQKVRSVTESSYFTNWYFKWRRASKLGTQGTDVDLEITDEI